MQINFTLTFRTFHPIAGFQSALKVVLEIVRRGVGLVLTMRPFYPAFQRATAAIIDKATRIEGEQLNQLNQL